MLLLSYALLQAIYAFRGQMMAVVCPLCRKQAKLEKAHLEDDQNRQDLHGIVKLDCMHQYGRIEFTVEHGRLRFDHFATCKECGSVIKITQNCGSDWSDWHQKPFYCKCKKNLLRVAKSSLDNVANREDKLQYFVDEVAYFNLLMKSRFVNKKQVQVLLLDKDSTDNFFRSEKGAKVLTSIAHYASSRTMIEVIGLLLSNLASDIVLSQMEAVDLKGRNALYYLSEYHIRFLSDFSEEKHLLIELLSKTY